MNQLSTAQFVNELRAEATKLNVKNRVKWFRDQTEINLKKGQIKLSTEMAVNDMIKSGDLS